MNHFELFGLPVSFNVDQELLKEKFNELSRKRGPGFDANSTQADQSSQVMKAYRIFQDQDETIKYVLQIKNMLEEEEEKYELDPQFLMEVMDINEESVELGLDEKQEQLMNVEQKTNRLLLKIYDDVAPVIESYKEDTTTEEELLQVKEFYYQKKYLQRILEKVRKIRNMAPPS